MTSDSPGRGPRRASGGRHAGPPRPGPEQARAAREAAFGHARRTWVGAPTSDDEADAAPEESTRAAEEPTANDRESAVGAHGEEPETEVLAPVDEHDGEGASAAGADAANAGTAGAGAAGAGAAGAGAAAGGGHGNGEGGDGGGRGSDNDHQGSAWGDDDDPDDGRREDGDVGRGQNPDDRIHRRTEDSGDTENSETADRAGREDELEGASAAAASRPAARRAGTSSTSRSAAGRRAAERRGQPAGRGPALARVVGWTVLTTILPGTGLLTTAMRRTGLVLLALFVVAGISLGAWVVFGDPVPTLLPLLTNRSFLNGLIALVLVIAVLWALQILLTWRAHAVAEKLPRKPRLIAFALSLLLIVAMLVPFGRGAQSLWAAQNLLGNESVFGGIDGDGPIKKGKDPWAGVGRLNVLLLGQDAGDDREGTRPDTIMVASIDTETGRTALFSIPRNLQWVRFPKGTPMAKEFPDGFDAYGKNQNLINAVWAWADEHKDKFPGDENPGRTATTQAVEQTLGLSMDYYAMVDLQGFSDLVDAIGGVDMNVERKIPIGGGTNQATGGKYKISGYIDPGWQKLDGYHALWYARSREGSNDFDRICRQQRMVRVVSEEADPTTLALAFPRLVTATEDNIQTDIPSKRLDAFADLGLRVKDSGFKSYPITPDVTNPGKADWDYLHKWVKASLKDSMKGAKSAESVKGGNGQDSPKDEASAASDGGGETPTETDSPETTSSKKPKDGDKPEIVEDPLKSCLPGAEQDPTATSAT